MAFAAISVVEAECEKSSATTYFWYREALDISNSISESGGLNWKMTLCLLVAWSIVGMAVVKGIQSSGKVSHEGALRATRGAAEKPEGQGLRTLGHPVQGPLSGLGLWMVQGDDTGPQGGDGRVSAAELVSVDSLSGVGLQESLALTPVTSVLR